jgi:hypothetical protein
VGQEVVAPQPDGLAAGGLALRVSALVVQAGAEVRVGHVVEGAEPARATERDRRCRPGLEVLEQREAPSSLSWVEEYYLRLREEEALRHAVYNTASMDGILSFAARSAHRGLGLIEASDQVDYLQPNGQVDRDGSCWAFVSEVLREDGAHGCYNPSMGPNANYVWGALVADINKTTPTTPIPTSAFAGMAPGDVIQFRNVRLSTGMRADQHSAIVSAVGQTGGVNNGTITVLEQNFNNQHFVTQETFNLAAMTAGKVWVYQPVRA